MDSCVLLLCKSIAISFKLLHKKTKTLYESKQKTHNVCGSKRKRQINCFESKQNTRNLYESVNIEWSLSYVVPV